jgi:hypothetical protein
MFVTHPGAKTNSVGQPNTEKMRVSSIDIELSVDYSAVLGRNYVFA